MLSDVSIQLVALLFVFLIIVVIMFLTFIHLEMTKIRHILEWFSGAEDDEGEKRLE